MRQCLFCLGAVNVDDPETYKQVSVWVNGPKADGAVLRQDMGKYAHKGCVDKLKAGQAPDQPDLFKESWGGNGDADCTCGTKPHREECPRYGR